MPQAPARLSPDDACFRWHPAARIHDADGPAAPGSMPGQLRRALQGGNGLRVAPDGITADLPAGLLHCRTGGTTGAPKVIERSHASWITSFTQNAADFGIEPGTGVAVLGGLEHSLALYAAVEGAHLGAEVHMLAGMAPRAQATALAQRGISVLYATPAQLSLLVAAGGALPALRHVLCGGGTLSPALRARVGRLCPNAAIRVFYGASETSFITLSDDETPEGSVGRPYGAVRIEIRGAEGTGAHTAGEVWVASPYLFARYADGSSAQTRRDGAYLTVGEMGWCDPAGYLFLTGRRDRMLRIAEQSVHPEAIEAWLMARHGVAAACVLPRVDAARGRVLVAVLAGAPDTALAARLERAARAEFGPLIAPRRYYFMPDFPLRSAGKPDIACIAQWLRAQP